MTRTRTLPRALTAADLMTREVVTLPQEMSLRAAARLLKQARISAAPVIDGRGRCIGVLSATEFVHRAQEDGEARPSCGPWPLYVSDWQLPDQKAVPTDDVRRYMSTDVVTVAPSIAVGDLVEVMANARVRRVIVVDEQQRPIGVVSRTDILVAVATLDQEAVRPTSSGQFRAHLPGPSREPGNWFDRHQTRRTKRESPVKEYDP